MIFRQALFISKVCHRYLLVYIRTAKTYPPNNNLSLFLTPVSADSLQPKPAANRHKPNRLNCFIWVNLILRICSRLA